MVKTVRKIYVKMHENLKREFKKLTTHFTTFVTFSLRLGGIVLALIQDGYWRYFSLQATIAHLLLFNM